MTLNMFTFTVRVTLSPISSLSISDDTDMMPSICEMWNRPTAAVESVKQCRKKMSFSFT